jgi:hypothetical protein
VAPAHEQPAGQQQQQQQQQQLSSWSILMLDSQHGRRALQLNQQLLMLTGCCIFLFEISSRAASHD